MAFLYFLNFMTDFIHSAPFVMAPGIEVIREVSKFAQKIIMLQFILEWDDPSEEE